MENGQPYRTEGLLAQRAAQRRTLRKAIPDWIMDAHRYGPAASVTVNGTSDPPYVESLVRRLAEDSLKELAELTETWETETAAIELALFFRRENGNDPNVELQKAEGALMNDVAASLEGLTPRTASRIEERHQAPLARAIRLLSWADDLAEDGYVDPRIAQNRPPSA